MSEIADNIARLRERIGAGVTLIAVTKKQPASAVIEALAAGIMDVGENYVQEAAQKQESLWPSQIQAARWHLLGHLQSNKARQAVRLFDLIQSVDSVKLAQTLGRQAEALGKTQEILLQVHLGGEETKTGLPPAEALDAAEAMSAIPGLALRGLMGIAPFGEEARPFFQQLRQIFDRLPAANRQALSMGMTGDFETAIEEGATMVRVGTAIFGPRSEK